MDQEKRNEKRRAIAAHKLDDGSLVELVFDPVARATRLAVSRGGEVEFVESLEEGGETLYPYSPDNNLIRHEALLLPSHPEPFVDRSQLFEDVCAFIHTYVDLTPDFERIAAQYILLSWVYDAFNELPYLRFQGDYGTGKTRGLLVLGNIAYRPFFASGASTVSPIFHTLDAFRGTLIFDEADFRMSDEKAELVKILNNGTVRGMPVLRTLINQKKEFNPAAFQVFGPKIVATRGTYEDRALESRFLTELMGGRPLRHNIPINLPSNFKPEALHIRNQLLCYRLTHFHTVRLNPALVDLSLEPRQNQVLVPLLSITDDEGLRSTIRGSVRLHGHVLMAERGVSVEGLLLQVLLALLDTHQEGSIPMKLVRDAFIQEHDADFERPITTRYLTSILRRRLSIRVLKTMGIMAVPRTEEPRIREIGKRFGLDNVQPPLSREIGRKGDSGESLLPTAPGE